MIADPEGKIDMTVHKSFARTFVLAIITVLTLTVTLPTTPCRACFSIVVGKEASADGYVITAHNEDDTAPQIVNHHKVPRRKHSADETVTLLNGGKLEQVEQTWSYIWSEMPGMLFSDSYINEWGVSVTSDNCPSREDKPEITDGGIGYMLRRLIAERAKTAREGVLLAGKLVERFGYIDSGRTYVICDPEEGWLFCVVNGKHWLAQRVSDNEVAMVANTYTIRKVDLSDGGRFLASADIITYAQSRGWYNAERHGQFDFAAVYANPMSASHPSNIGRQMAGLNYVLAKPITSGSILPFSVVPRRKIVAGDLMQILRHDSSPAEGSAELGRPICSEATQTSFVAQLRRTKPIDVGIVYWMCLACPRTSFYIPFHFGISEFPPGFSLQSQRPSKESYDEKVNSPFEADSSQAFWTFSNFRDKVGSSSAETVARVKALAGQVETKALAGQKGIEDVAGMLYATDKTASGTVLASYSKRIYESALEAMGHFVAQIAENK